MRWMSQVRNFDVTGGQFDIKPYYFLDKLENKLLFVPFQSSVIEDKASIMIYFTRYIMMQVLTIHKNKNIFIARKFRLCCQIVGV